VKGLGAAIKVGMVVLLAVVVGYGMFKSVSEQAAGSDGYELWARFNDASGLVDKSRVVIAGLVIGEITDRRLDGKFARVTVRLRKETQIWSNAAIFKKSSSLLGEFYLEIDPGSPQAVDVRGQVVENRLLRNGDEIVTVIEATSVSDLVAQVSKIVPHVDEVLLEVRDLAAEARKVVNGPVANIANNLDRAVAEDTALVKNILERTDRISANIDAILTQARPDVSRTLTNVEAASGELRELLAVTRGEIEQTGSEVRARLDNLDRILAQTEATMGSAASIGKKIDEPQGTLGKLVNDPTIADNAAQITEDVRGFTQGLFGLQTIVGMRTEYNLIENLTRAYFSVEILPRADKFYLFELVSDPRGDLKNTLIVNENQEFERRQLVEWQGIKFTAMYGRRFDWLSVRAGIKDSTGGIGADLAPWRGRATLSLDLFQFTYDRWPRFRAGIALRFFEYLYITGGIDDILNAPTRVPIAGNNFTGDLPREFFYGRQPYFGAMIKFTDEDLRTLLFVAGSALSGAVK
jgi:phospholipid/cholesterol/gamma-HCH transport system substrate-binding protein